MPSRIYQPLPLMLLSTLVIGCSQLDLSQNKQSGLSAKTTLPEHNSTKTNLPPQKPAKAPLPLQASLPAVEEPTRSAKQFPDDVRWSNVKTDFGAVGDGKTDDTQAILRAIQAPFNDYTRPKILYFPEGTYLVKDTLLLTGKPSTCCITFQGQGQGKTIIKLMDQASGFNTPQMPKPVIKTTQGNSAFRHYFRDFTLSTGKGNVGAVGIDYISNNRGAIKNVSIKSEDGAGIAGLQMTRKWPGPSLIKNVFIQGFDYGIQVQHPEYGLTFERIKLKQQKQAGILNRGNTLAIRDLQSDNAVPGIINKGRGMVVLVDGSFQGGTSNTSAIVSNADLYARNIQAQGYQSALNQANQVVPGLAHSEYISNPAYSLFDTPKSSLNLPIEETPEFHDNNVNNWANIKDYPSVQAAMNSGKSTIYFPKGYHKIKGIVNIPPTVQKIVGFESFINLHNKRNIRPDNQEHNAIFQVQGESDKPLIFEGLLFPGALVQHQSPRTLVIKHSKGPKIENSPNAGKLFIEDAQLHLNLEHPQQVWARQLNAESLRQAQTKVANRGGAFWIFGLKTEGKGSVIETTQGGKTELLGTLIYPVHQFSPAEEAQAAFINQDSSHSLIYSVSAYGPRRNYKIQVKEVQKGETRVLTTKEMADRVMPLFVGRNP